MKVFAITTFFSIIAYLWLIVILVGVSKDVVEIWEAAVTLAMFPLLVILAYWADKGLPFGKSAKVVAENGKQIELGTIQSGECKCEHFRLVFPATSAAMLVPLTTREPTPPLIKLAR